MKRCGAALLLALLVIVNACALAEPVTNAGAQVKMEQVKRYPSFAMDELSGSWSFRSVKADSLEELLSRKANALYSRGVITLRLEICGNVQTGVVTPVLSILYAGSDEINAGAVSVVVGDTRYDLAAHSEKTEIGRYEGEEIRIALDEQGLEMLQMMADSGSCSLCLHGEKRYETELELEEEYAGDKAQIESESLLTLDIMDEVDWNTYGLWDLTAAAWLGETGVEMRMEKTRLGRDTAEPEVDEVFGLVEQNSENNRALQELLIEAGFLSGKADGAYAQRVGEAVKSAQQYYGLMITGTADRALCEMLKGASAAEEAEKAPLAAEAVNGQQSGTQAGVAYTIADAAQITLHRYWFADSLPAVSEAGLYTQQAVLNTSNELLIADGSIQNLNADSMAFYTDITAALVYEGKYEYSCSVVCERDGGAGFDSMLLPLAESRLVIYGEIPQNLREAEGQWQLKLEVGSGTLIYDLK